MGHALPVCPNTRGDQDGEHPIRCAVTHTQLRGASPLSRVQPRPTAPTTAPDVKGRATSRAPLQTPASGPPPSASTVALHPPALSLPTISFARPWPLHQPQVSPTTAAMTTSPPPDPRPRPRPFPGVARLGPTPVRPALTLGDQPGPHLQPEPAAPAAAARPAPPSAPRSRCGRGRQRRPGTPGPPGSRAPTAAATWRRPAAGAERGLGS